jgi:diguanylate cyclase (GGDEF)-like protein
MGGVPGDPAAGERAPMPARLLLTTLLLFASALHAADGPASRGDRKARRAVDPATLEVEPIARVLADADRDTVPDRKGQAARVRGVVVVPTGVLRTHGFQVLIQDETGGIGLYDRDGTARLASGDVVEAWGEVSQYRGAVQLSGASVHRVGQATVPTARALPVAEADAPTHLGRRVAIEGIVGDLMLDAHGMLRVTGDDGGMVSLFIPAAVTDRFDWKRYPRGTRVRATGVLSIYKPTWPYDGGYQVVVSDPAELVALHPPTPPWQKWILWAVGGGLLVVAAGGAMLQVLQRRQRARETELKTLSALSAALATTDVDEPRLARNACEILTAYGIADVVAVHGAGDLQRLVQLAASSADPSLQVALEPGAAPGTVELGGSAHARRIEAHAAATGLHVVAMHPLQGNEPFGMLVAASRRRRRASRMQERTLLSAAKLLAMALENARSQQRARDEQRELQQLVITDELTRLYNRRFLDEYLRVQLPLAQRRGSGLGFLAIDIDHFKHVNDTYGHEAGDRVLAGVAGLLRRSTRSCDLPVRMGGEEFVVVIAEHDIDSALAFAERLRAEIAAQSHEEAAAGADLHVTVSIGVALFGIHGRDAATLLRASDEALYASKRAGRDRVTLSTHIETTSA